MGEDQHGAAACRARPGLELGLQAGGQPRAAALAIEHLDRRAGSRVVLEDDGQVDLLLPVANRSEDAPRVRSVL